MMRIFLHSFPSRIFGMIFAGFLCVSLAEAATASSDIGTVLSGTYALTQNVSSGYIVYDGNSGGNSTSGAMYVGDLDSTAGVPVAYSFTLPIDLGTGPIAFLGIDSTGGVALTANGSVAPLYTGASWPYAESEPAITSAVNNGDTATMVSFLRAHPSDFFYAPSTTQATFLAFSNGQAIGAMSLQATPTPEPRSLLLAAVGIFCMARLLRGRRPLSRESSIVPQG